MRVFYGAGHEQFTPSELLAHARLAEEAGFAGVACSDHFQPWWASGQSGHAWPWLGAAGAATTRVAVGTAVTPAVKRYHPALVAQAFATLEELFPGRVFLGVGSGESLNESPVGCDWPDGETQLALLEEALDVIRRLWAGETLDGGRHFRMKAARLYTRPASPPPLYVSAFHEGAAKAAARYGDGLWCLGDRDVAPDVIETYRAGSSDDGREPGEIILQALVSWGRDDDEALESARPWKGAQPPEYYVDDWHDPAAMYEHGEQTVSDDEFKAKAIISADPEEHVERLREVIAFGATTLAVMNCSGADPEGAICMYREHVLPDSNRDACMSGLNAKDALLVIDAVDLFDHEDADELLRSYRSRLQGLRAAIDATRARNVPVVYVNDHHGRWDGDAPGLLEAACSGPGSEVIAAIRPGPGEPFLFKARYSAFDHTLLEILLAELDAERLILVGGTTEGCVVQSGIDARELGFKVTIVANACASIDDDLEQLALRYAREVAGIQVVASVTELLA